MDASVRSFIDDAFERSRVDHKSITKDDVLRMLSLDPHSEECEYLGSKARELARIRSNNKANLTTAFGIDYRPCKASCTYCSFGERWGLMDGLDMEIPVEDIIDMIREQYSKGYRKFTLRTTEYYPVEKLCAMGKEIREKIPGKYGLGVNTGELSAEDLKALHESGFNSAYHTLHLGEGIDTIFKPMFRLRTMSNIRDSDLNLTCGIDPIGIEHTDEEIASTLMILRDYEPMSICSMKRINPKGTPVESIPEVDATRVAQIAAVIRFASGGNVASVPPNKKAIEWGANSTTIGTGSNPRDSVHDPSTIGDWRFDFEDVKQMFLDCGYDI
ncbi:radical SAM protein [Candidatus Methanarcanum hacksteinii]|uniref:radical SAM protein n=1 Tax=Candidatus Methanarcanum hacksteinii TaxID=2911857 RepID=UPI0037DD02DF